MTKADLEQLSRQLAPDRFVSTLKLLVDEFPTSYFRILAAPRFKALRDFIFAQTPFCDEKPYGIATRVTYILNGKHDLFRCNCCGKAITHDISPLAYKPGQKFWCNSRCQADDPFLQKKLGSAIKKAKLKPKLKILPPECKITYHKGQIKFDRQLTKKVLALYYESPKQFKHAIRQHPTLLSYLLDMTYPISFTRLSFETRLTWLAEEMQQFPRCLTCGRQLDFENVKFSKGFKKYCCKKCKDMSNEIAEHMALKNSEVLISQMQKSQLVKPLFSVEELNKHKHSKHLFSVKCLECGRQFKAPIDENFHYREKKDTFFRCPHCYPKLSSAHTSKIERKLYHLIVEKFPRLHVINSDKHAIYPKELDIYVPSMNLAIEVNGSYWHKFDPQREESPQLAKTKLCEDKGIQLIHLWEDELNNSFDTTFEKLSQVLSQKKTVFETYSSQPYVAVDRAKVCLAAIDQNQWEVIGETGPQLVDRAIKRGTQLLVEDCGCLLLQKKHRDK